MRPDAGRLDLSRSHESPRPCKGRPEPIPRHSGATRSGEPGIHTPDRGYGFRACAFGASRNDGVYFCPPDAAMISCSVATWRAKAPRPVAVAVTVVCGFLPTKALSTAT